ncbi:hypothetical protein ACFLSJ_03230 [Verrucomicrobiota bacterium]
MTRRRSRALLGLPSLGIALLWGGLWLLWPWRAGVNGTEPDSRRMMIRHGWWLPQDYDLFRHPFWDIPAKEIDMSFPVERRPRAEWIYDGGSPILLARESAGPGASDPDFDEWLGGRFTAGSRAYRPAWEDDAVFTNAPLPQMRLLAEVSPDLEQCGFRIPALPVSAGHAAESPWRVQLYVEFDGEGRVENVFLESGCDDAEINADLVRAMHRAKVETAGRPCSGRVTLSFGRQ